MNKKLTVEKVVNACYEDRRKCLIFWQAVSSQLLVIGLLTGLLEIDNRALVLLAIMITLTSKSLLIFYSRQQDFENSMYDALLVFI